MTGTLAALRRWLVGSGPDHTSGTDTRALTDGGRSRSRSGGQDRQGGPSLSNRLWNVLSGDGREEGNASPTPPTEIDPAEVLDHSGSFCERTFERKTGCSVSTFVVDFVEEHGGVVRQQAIVNSLPWSDSKVSRLLTDLECDGRVVRRSIGRENAVFLPEAVTDGS